MLGVILGYTEIALMKGKTDQPMYSALRGIQQAAQRSADLTRQLLAFARKQTVAPKVLDLNEAVASMLIMLRRLIGENIDLVWLPDESLGAIKMDYTQIDQILANLCINARDAIRDTGRITIETSNVIFDEAYCASHLGFAPGEYILLMLSDNGCGMDRETISHLFEPFFTTKEMGKGTGLGLPTVYGIVKQNDGFINVYSELGLGTTFKIYLPRHKVQDEKISEPEGTEPVTTGHETILLVEDEPMILEMTTVMLELQGYTVLSANSAGEAISLAREYSGKIHLLMTDVVMPEMNGRDLARNLLPLYPHLKRLFMSGYTANVIAHHGVLDAGVHFLQKPFTMQDLATKIRAVLVENDPGQV
jgi:CheY-like chemotaxis protein